MLDAGGGGGAAFGAAAADAVAAIGKQTANFASAAAQGHFAVSPRGGRALLQAITDMKDWLNGAEIDLMRLDRQPPLGGSHGAQAIKPYVQNVATDKQGFITMLRAFGQSLNDAEQGIRDAMNNYHKLDTELAKPYTAEA